LAVADIVKAAVPEPVMFVGLILAVRPDEGVTDNETVPPKLFTAVTFTIDVN
jgi:hypothetical protein